MNPTGRSWCACCSSRVKSADCSGGTKMTVAPRAWSQADSGTQALRVGSRITVTEASSGILAHRRSRSAVVVRNFHDDQMNSPRSSARLARWSARQATSMPNLTSFMAWSFLRVADQSALRRRPLHVPQGCDHPDIREAGVRPTDRPPSSRKGMHVRREARLTDDHRHGVELSPAPAPVQSSQRNRPDVPYEGLPPNRWMPRTNAKCPCSPGLRLNQPLSQGTSMRLSSRAGGSP